MAIVIDVKLKNENKTLAAFDAMHRKFKSIDKTISGWADKLTAAAESAERLAKAINSINPQRMRGGGGSQGSGGQRSTGGKRPPSLFDQFAFADRMNKVSGGKFQTQRDDLLRRAFGHYQKAAAGGDPDALRKLTRLVKPHHDLMSPPAQKSRWDRVMQAIMTSRFNIGSGGLQVQPLIGRTLAAALGTGAGGAAGAAGMAGGAAAGGLAAIAGPIAVAVAAIVGLAKAAMWAGGVLKEMASGLVTGGGSAHQAATARGIGLATGLGPDAGARFQKNIESGVAAGFASSIGITPMGGPFGDINYNAKLIKAAEAIIATGTLDDARRLAEGLGTPELANLKMYSKGTQRDILNRFGSGASQKEMEAGMELGYWTSRLSEQFQLLASRILLPVVKVLSTFFDWIQKLIALFDAFAQVFYPWFGASDGKTSNPVKENTKALNDNTRAVREMREQMGGGRRAGEALPGKLNGLNLNDMAVRTGLAGGYS